MATVSFRYGEGSRTTTRTVQGVSGGSLSGFIRINTALTTPSPGDIVEIFTGALSGNAAFYNLTNFSGGTGGLGLYVRPAPNQQLAVGGSIVRLNRAPQRTSQAGTAISGITLVSGAPGLAVVHAPGLGALASGVQINDRAAVSGSSISGNMGGWYVHRIINDDTVILRPPDRGPGMTAESPGTGTISIRQGFHTVLTVPTENEQLSWATTWGVSGILPAQGSLSGYQGSGELRDYVQVIQNEGAAAGARPTVHVRVQGIGRFLMGLSGLSGISWSAKNECLSIPYVAGAGTVDAVPFRTQASGTAPPRPCIIRLGSPVFVEGSPASGSVDRYSVASGSSWVGFSINPATNHTSIIPQWHGSYYDDPDDDLVYAMASGTSGVASVVRVGAVAPPTGFTSESLTIYDNLALSEVGAPDIQNLLIPSTASGLTGTTATAGGIIEGLLLGAGVFAPFMATTFAAGDPLFIRNPRTDIDIYTYFYVLVGGGSIEKDYTYNPRFRSADGGAPVSGLYVQIYEVSDISGESLLLAEFTDANGRIGGGAGYNLRTQRIDGTPGYQLGDLTSYTYRVVTQGGGYRLVSRDFVFTDKFVQDITVAHVAPDYEGEYDE